MDCNIDQRDDVMMVQLVGSLTISGVLEAHRALLPVLTSKNPVQLDFTQMSDCDTAGAQLLYAMISSLRKVRQPVSLTQVPTPVMEGFARIGLQLEAEQPADKEKKI